MGSRGDRDREGRAGWLLRGSLRSCEGGEMGVALNWLHLEGLILPIEGYSLGSHGWLNWLVADREARKLLLMW